MPTTWTGQAGRLLRRIPHLLTTRAAASRLGGESISLEPWQSWSIKTPQGSTLKVTATPAHHGPVGIDPHLPGTSSVSSSARSKRGSTWRTSPGTPSWYSGTREVAEEIFRPRVVLLFGGGVRRLAARST